MQGRPRRSAAVPARLVWPDKELTHTLYGAGLAAAYTGEMFLGDTWMPAKHEKLASDYCTPRCNLLGLTWLDLT